MKAKKGKKYESIDEAGLECLDCTLPLSVCCGNPKRCKAKFEKSKRENQNENRVF